MGNEVTQACMPQAVVAHGLTRPWTRHEQNCITTTYIDPIRVAETQYNLIHYLDQTSNLVSFHYAFPKTRANPFHAERRNAKEKKANQKRATM